MTSPSVWCSAQVVCACPMKARCVFASLVRLADSIFRDRDDGLTERNAPWTLARVCSALRTHPDSMKNYVCQGTTGYVGLGGGGVKLGAVEFVHSLFFSCAGKNEGENGCWAHFAPGVR